MVQALDETGRQRQITQDDQARAGLHRLQTTSPVWNALAWIGIYVVVVNAGDWLSGVVGVPNSVTALLLVALSVGLVLFLRRGGWLTYYGVRPLRRGDANGTLLYVPLVLIVGLQYVRGLRDDLTVTAVLLIVALMVCVGFLEELIFRGMLFRGIQRTSTLTRAVMISGITFGVGHVVNLARGMTPLEQAVQVGFGVVLGIVLALLFVVTGTIIPLIAFHTLLNISGNLVVADPAQESLMLAVTTVICAGYAAYLVQVLRRQGPNPAVVSGPPVLTPGQPDVCGNVTAGTTPVSR